MVLQKAGYFHNMGKVGISTKCRKSLKFSLIFYLVLALQGCATMAQEKCEWHCFHGPDRANKSPDTGLLKEWPEEGPELVWTI